MIVRHFGYVPDSLLEHVFEQRPAEFDSFSTDIGAKLGGTLYVPGTKPDLGQSLIRLGAKGTVALVVCWEDSIPTTDLELARTNLLQALRVVQTARSASLPLMFCRPRAPTDLEVISDCDPSGLLSGVVLPKFDPRHAESWFHAVRAAGRNWTVMPILESAAMADPSVRVQWLADSQAALRRSPTPVAAVRLGGVDLLGCLGIRRARHLTAYDYGPLRDAISDTLGVFGCANPGLPISAPVWEHLPTATWASGPLRAATTVGHGLLARELRLDQAHGLCGKTAVHPGQVTLINAHHTVSHEDYEDAVAVLQGGGAARSVYGTRMNESQPHRLWAERTVRRAADFGVRRREVSVAELVRRLALQPTSSRDRQHSEAPRG